MPELHISTAKVCDFIEAAREVAGKVAPTTGDRTTTGDDSKLVTIEDYPGTDARRGQMREFIFGLNVAEQIELFALILLGRGDFDIAEWPDAVPEARDRIADGGPDYMIGDAALRRNISAWHSTPSAKAAPDAGRGTVTRFGGSHDMQPRLTEPCKTCDGTGRVPRPRRHLPNGEIDSLDTIEWPEVICAACNGSGRVPLDHRSIAETTAA